MEAGRAYSATSPIVSGRSASQCHSREGSSTPIRGPSPPNALVAEQMRRMPRASTGPEVALRRVLHAGGLRFTVNRRDLPGTPDVVFSRARVAVFLDGCFWHACPSHGVVPTNNREWWVRKFEANRERDRRKDAELVKLGWLPVHFWEHEEPELVAASVASLWRERVGAPSPRPKRGRMKC